MPPQSRRGGPWRSDVDRIERDGAGIGEIGIELKELQHVAQRACRGAAARSSEEPDIDLLSRKDGRPPLQLSQVVAAQTIPFVVQIDDPFIVGDFVDHAAAALEIGLPLTEAVPGVRPGPFDGIAHQVDQLKSGINLRISQIVRRGNML